MHSPFTMSSAPRVLVLVGTRPECLKLIPLIRALRDQGHCQVAVVSSGQHADMVARTLAQFGMAADIEIMSAPPRVSLSHAVRHLRDGARRVITEWRADAVVVQGDTSTAYAGALAARAARVPLAHVEAGLRTDHPWRPFPEELFRRRIAPLADWHFAPTERARANLLAEGARHERVWRVGNTGIDLLRLVLADRDRGRAEAPAWREHFARLITLTLHRRENYGRRLDVVVDAVRELLHARPDLGVVCPLHPNPAVATRLRRLLGDEPRVILTEALPYRPFVALLADSALVITDSGGIQEEAPYLGVPVLVARENTERPESAECGTARLVPVDAARIAQVAGEMLDAPRPTAIPFDEHAPYGDGHAGARIAQTLAEVLDATQHAALAPAWGAHA